MQSLRAWLGGTVGLLCLVACSGTGQFDSGGTEDSEGIVGGQVDSTHHGVFGILIKDQALCSGTLIAPNLVLTARHCVADVSTGENPIDCSQSTFSAAYTASSFMLSSSSDLTAEVPPNSVFRVSSVHTPDDSSFCGNDVALLTLSSNVPSDTAAPITPGVDQPPQDNAAYTAIGYGLTDPNDTQGTTAGVRHSVSGLAVGCVGPVECQGRISADEWASNSAICSGDSGGPALDTNNLVIGVASRGDQTCAVGLYSSVASWKSLIVGTAVDAAMSGGYTPPDWTTGSTAGTAGTTNGTGGAANTGGAENAGGLQAGGRSATGGAAGGLVSPGPMLGDACDSGCFGDLLCYSATSTPPGVCVPPCSAESTTCPATYQCNSVLGACVPLPSTTSGASGSGNGEPDAGTGAGSQTKSSGCGCRIGADRASSSAWPAFALLAFCGGMLRRTRRRVTHA